MRLNDIWGFGDWRTATKIARLASKLGVDALHGHVAKGGAYGLVAERFTVENRSSWFSSLRAGTQGAN
jgi:hypothetical protein